MFAAVHLAKRQSVKLATLCTLWYFRLVHADRKFVSQDLGRDSFVQWVAPGALEPGRAPTVKLTGHTYLQVIKAAAEDEMVTGELLQRLTRGDEATLRWVRRHMYIPKYRSIVHMPVGVNE